MIDYKKNDLIDECLVRFYETFEHTLDTADFVPEKYNDKILAYIFKCMRKNFKQIDREYRQYQKEQLKKVREQIKVLSEKLKMRNQQRKCNQ